MIGITRFARFAGVAGWPAVFPPFVKAAWLSVLPEYNPFKYDSFPINAGTPDASAHHSCAALQTDIGRPWRAAASPRCRRC